MKMSKIITIFGMFLIILFSFSSAVSAGISYGSGYYTNLCGTGTAATAYACPASCSPGSGSCSGSYVYKFTCPGNTIECTSGGGYVGSYAQMSAGCGHTQQIDVFSKRCDVNGQWVCGPDDLKGYMVWYSGDCAPQPPACTDECSAGQKKCSGDSLYTCQKGSDGCYDWVLDKNCYFTDYDDYYVCENDDSVHYTQTTTGFCKDKIGYNDECSQKTTTTKGSVVDCGTSSSNSYEFCMNDDVYSRETGIQKGCDQNTGMCYSNSIINDPVLLEDCGNSQSSNFCSNDDVVYLLTTEHCVENNNDAYCEPASESVLVEECGSDVCIPFTDKDPYVREHVDDYGGCDENGYAYCVADQMNIQDFCLPGTDYLIQVYCEDEDHAFDNPYDCTQLNGCFEYEADQCFYCDDSYGNCYEKNCTVTGLEYHEYSCSSGACTYNTIRSPDMDKDHKVDGYCDDCIDVDRDGICDDADNCPGVSNPNQIDYDKDGLGNACDDDRDNDGYPGSVDCNDWNPGVNPGMEEILGNGIDDDCNPETSDIALNTPREILFVDIQTNEDTMEKGDNLLVMISVTNKGRDRLNQVKISATVPEFQLRDTDLTRKFRSGETFATVFDFDLPDSYSEEFVYLRVAVGDDDLKRVIYREIKLPK